MLKNILSDTQSMNRSKIIPYRERPGEKHLEGFLRIRKPGPHSSKRVILVYSHVKKIY